MTDSAEATTADPPPYQLAFLTDQWEWERDVGAQTLADAKDQAREALLHLVQTEAPQLACVTLLEHGVKVGVWDWVERQAYWTPL